MAVSVLSLEDALVLLFSEDEASGVLGAVVNGVEYLLFCMDADEIDVRVLAQPVRGSFSSLAPSKPPIIDLRVTLRAGFGSAIFGRGADAACGVAVGSRVSYGLKDKYNTMRKVASVAYPAESKVSYCWCLPCVRSVELQQLERMTVVCP